MGKTALLQHFAHDKSALFLTGADRGEAVELGLLSSQVATTRVAGTRDLAERPYVSWDDALDDLAARATATPLLLVLDEFPELAASTPALAAIIRAFIDRARGQHRLRILLCGSAVRTMTSMQEERAALYGRFDLAMLLHPFAPHEVAAALPRLAPAERAAVWGIVGGMPLYLRWWDQSETFDENLVRLALEPGARLLTEGDLVLRTEADAGDLARRTLTAIATGRTQWSEIKDAIGAEPARTLERLGELGLVTKVEPVGSGRTRRRVYRIADPFLRFHLGVLGRHRSSIERGLGRAALPEIRATLAEHMGGVWEDAFRSHLLRRAAEGSLPGEPIVDLGAWWAEGQGEIDAVGLAGRDLHPVLAGEAKWAKQAHGPRVVAGLRKKVEAGLGVEPDALTYVVCARGSVTDLPPGALAVTATEIFSPPESAS